MIDPLDPHTKTLDLDPSAPAQVQRREEAAPGVPSIAKERTEARLADEFDLIRLHAPVYVLDKKAAATRSAGAERVARHREKLAAEGLRPAAVPAAVLDAVKAAGGWAEWQAQTTAAVAVAPPLAPPPQIIEKLVEVEKLVDVPGPERIVEKIVEVPAQLSKSDFAALQVGRKTQSLTGWRAAVVRWLTDLR